MYGLEDVQTSFHAEFENNKSKISKSEVANFRRLKERNSSKIRGKEQETVQNTEMGFLWKSAGSFSLKWDFDKMGFWYQNSSTSILDKMGSR